jgi:uncharacterized protein (TIGR03435 family)
MWIKRGCWRGWSQTVRFRPGRRRRREGCFWCRWNIDDVGRSSRVWIIVTLRASHTAITALALPIVIGFINAPVAEAQSQAATAAPRPAFEVAFVKLNKSANVGQIRVLRGGRFTLIDLPMQEIIKMAYHIRKDSQLSGAPAWFTSERYDVEARAEGNPPFDVMRTMLQTLLEDRIQLKFHHETKQLPVYSLAVAKPGKLRETDGDCGTASNSPAPPDPTQLPNGPCGFLFILPGHILGQKGTLIQLVDALSLNTDRVVLDETNLARKYDIKLEYTPEGPIPPPLADPGMPPLPPIDPNGPSLFTALQEQLGLKLESRKRPVEIMVVDHVVRPSAY